MSGGMITTDVSGKAEVVLTTKGDLATWDTARVRKGVSATNYTGLQADSAIADGLSYGATARSTLTGAGSLLYSSSANTLSELSAGTGEYTLKMNAGATAPEWVNVSAGGVTTNSIDTIVTSAFSTTSTSFVVITGAELTLSNQSNGLAICHGGGVWENTVADNNMAVGLHNDGVLIDMSLGGFTGRVVGRYANCMNSIGNVTTDGSVIGLEVYAVSGTCNIPAFSDEPVTLKAFEVY